METNQNLLNVELAVDSRVTSHLKETAGWARFLGICGFVVAVLLAIVAFVIPAMLTRQMSSYPYNSYESRGISGMMGGVLTFIYLIGAAMIFFVSLFTYKFGSKTKQAIINADQESLDKGLMNLKFLFRFWGIIMIIYLVLILLGILAGGMTAMFGR